MRNDWLKTWTPEKLKILYEEKLENAKLDKDLTRANFS
jgi:hypothetical protein